jgi:hypothetical protein
MVAALELVLESRDDVPPSDGKVNPSHFPPLDYGSALRRSTSTAMVDGWLAAGDAVGHLRDLSRWTRLDTILRRRSH